MFSSLLPIAEMHLKQAERLAREPSDSNSLPIILIVVYGLHHFGKGLLSLCKQYRHVL